MSHKSKSINNSRFEVRKIYNQRRYIKKLEEQINKLKEENKILSEENNKIAIMYLVEAFDCIKVRKKYEEI